MNDPTGIRIIDFSPEFKFKTSRSSGSGGQHVNKVETRVELLFNVGDSTLLDDQQKKRIGSKLKKRINADGVLRVVSEHGRSQSANKGVAIDLFYDLLEEALKVPKKRKPSKPSKASKEKRLKEKKKQTRIVERKKKKEKKTKKKSKKKKKRWSLWIGNLKKKKKTSVLVLQRASRLKKKKIPMMCPGSY